jgi:hypothetical protein
MNPGFKLTATVTSPFQESVMQPYLVSVFYKQQSKRPTIDELLFPERLQSGVRFTRVFKGQIDFSNVSDENVLDKVFATFNGHGPALPPNTSIPRSMCVGDIIVTGEETGASLVTATGFKRLPFTPRDENFEITQILSCQLATTTSTNLYSL